MTENFLSEQIKKINESTHLSETEKDRLISELLKQITPHSNRLEFNPASRQTSPNPAGGYILSFLFPPLGLFIGGRYLFRYGENGVKPGIICIVLTSVSLIIQLLLFKNMFRALLSGLPSLKIPGM